MESFIVNSQHRAVSVQQCPRHKAAVLYVNLTCWTGDDLVALVDWNMGAEKRGAPFRIFGLFHDCREVSYIISKTRRNMQAREHYEKGRLVCAGYEPLPVPADLKRLREDCDTAHHARDPALHTCVEGVHSPARNGTRIQSQKRLPGDQ